MTETQVYSVAEGKYVPFVAPTPRKRGKAAKAIPDTLPGEAPPVDDTTDPDGRDLAPIEEAKATWGNSLARQQWLERGATYLASLLAEHGHVVPDKVRVTIGFPFGSRTAIGQAWHAASSSDAHGEIFVSPVLIDGARILDVLLHELCHAVLGQGKGHGAEFKACATSVGLCGKMRSTEASPELKAKLDTYVASVGPYPAGALDVAISERKKQSTRMIKCECEDCGYSCRTTRQWLEMGAPICPVDNVPMVAK